MRCFPSLTYFAHLFWPAGLTPWYPNPEDAPAVWAVALVVVAFGGGVGGGDRPAAAAALAADRLVLVPSRC